MGQVVVALDRSAIADLAVRYDAVIQLVPASGDHVPAGGALLNVYGSRELPGRRLRRAVVLGDKRTIDDDPAFAIRMLVDVAIKALSPAVNDPTTAVRSLDRIEDLLRYAASKHLSTGTVTDKHGAVRLVYPTPTWEDLVELALDEIRAFGAGQYQVGRRLRALLDALIADLPENDVRPWPGRAPCSTTRSHPPFPAASAPPPSSLTARGSACHAVRRSTGTDRCAHQRPRPARHPAASPSCKPEDPVARLLTFGGLPAILELSPRAGHPRAPARSIRPSQARRPHALLTCKNFELVG